MANMYIKPVSAPTGPGYYGAGEEAYQANKTDIRGQDIAKETAMAQLSAEERIAKLNAFTQERIARANRAQDRTTRNMYLQDAREARKQAREIAEEAAANERSRALWGGIGTVGGAVLGGFAGNPALGAILGGKAGENVR